MSQSERWAGRNTDKDAIRAEIWTALAAAQVNVGDVWSHIPDFTGAADAAERLSQLAMWRQATVIKSNPDAPQIPVRRRALEDGKLLYVPVPELTEDYPFLLLDPADLQARGIAFDDVAPIAGAMEHGQRVRFEEMKPIDVVVVGCVAVTRDGARTGKGGGFADLELGIFREMGIVSPETPVVTTVHELQVVDDGRLVMQAHDNPLHWIITPTAVIETTLQYPVPQGVVWDSVQADQLRDIPFLVGIKDRLTNQGST